jgi:hypothetical protein
VLAACTDTYSKRALIRVGKSVQLSFYIYIYNLFDVKPYAKYSTNLDYTLNALHSSTTTEFLKHSSTGSQSFDKAFGVWFPTEGGLKIRSANQKISQICGLK